jgi:uronate dehydrogenase
MKVALTGAAGRLGRALRPVLIKAGHELRSTDLGDPPELLRGETWHRGDLREPAVVDALLQDIEVVVHLAATSNEQAFALVLENNHRALFELYEGARRCKVRRIVQASSNHAFGMHLVTRKLRLNDAYRPDGFYGLSKVWGEALARMYWEKHGIEGVALRIGTFMGCPPRSPRELATWLGGEDLARLVTLAVEAEGVGFAPVWGVSNNTRAWVDLSEGNALGYEPTQDAERYSADVLSKPGPVDAIADRYQGGRFVTQDYTPDEERPGP